MGAYIYALSTSLSPLRISISFHTTPPYFSTGNLAFDIVGDPQNILKAIASENVCSCSQYADSSCCTLQYNVAVSKGSVYQGWSFDQCGKTISAKCKQFMNAQECNFACDPRTSSKYYKSPVPLCGSYCDAWFSACENDFTCSPDWSAWPFDSTSGYTCNKTNTAGFQTCKTFKDTFRTAQNFCGGTGGNGGLWGTVYSYDSTNNSSKW